MKKNKTWFPLVRDFFLPRGSEYEDELGHEILKSEKIRIITVIMALDLYILIGLVVTFLIPDSINPIDRLFGENFPYYLFLGALVVATVYELLTYWFVSYTLRKGKLLPMLWQYGNASAEAFLISFLVYSVADAVNPSYAINSSFFLGHFYFIILSTLRLNPGVSLYTGFISAIFYLILSAWLLPQDKNPHYFYTDLFLSGSRSTMMAISGLMAGLVSYQIKKRIKDSVRNLQEKKDLRRMFGAYVSPELVQKLLSQTNPFSGEMRYTTILFLDIRGFTGFCENRHPQEIIEYLNLFFGKLIGVVNANKGVINKFLGDGFMAVFGAPIDDGKDSENAVKAAIEIRRVLENMNQSGEIPHTKIGMGIHRGEVVTGNVGSNERMEYTIIGDTVNLASRLEQLTKEFKTDIIISKDVYEELEGSVQQKASPLPEINVRGRVEKITIFALEAA